MSEALSPHLQMLVDTAILIRSHAQAVHAYMHDYGMLEDSKKSPKRMIAKTDRAVAYQFGVKECRTRVADADKMLGYDQRRVLHLVVRRERSFEDVAEGMGLPGPEQVVMVLKMAAGTVARCYGFASPTRPAVPRMTPELV